MDGKKTWLKPMDPHWTIEIDFTEDIETIRERIKELKEEYEKGTNPNKEAGSSEEANTDTKE